MSEILFSMVKYSFQSDQMSLPGMSLTRCKNLPYNSSKTKQVMDVGHGGKDKLFSRRAAKSRGV